MLFSEIILNKVLKTESLMSVEAAASGQPAGQPPSGEQRGNSGRGSGQNSVLPGGHQTQVFTPTPMLTLPIQDKI